MNVFWVALLFGGMLIPQSTSCPEKCICLKRSDSDFSIDCTNLGIVTFPPDVTTDDLNFHQTEFAVIDLSQNEIIRADFTSLPYKTVGRINLAYNEIATMKNVTVSDVESLKELDLSHNKRLEKVTTDLKSKSLEILTMRNCSISEVEEGFLESVPSLKLMDISHNSLLEMGHFVPLSPKDLDSDEDFIPNDDKRFQLTHLNISDNELVKVHGKDFKYTKIKVLDISRNKISHLKFTMYLPHLEELYASRNSLKTLEGLSAPNLILLDVSHNKVKDFHFNFHLKSPKLRVLQMCHNHIEKVTTIKSSTIIDLDVSYCRVRIIEPKAFSRLERLERLNLVGNELTSIHQEVFLHSRHLQFLSLGENPWSCNCSSVEFTALYNLVLFERYYSNGDDLHCGNDTSKSWSVACENGTQNNDFVMTERGAFYTMLYIFATLFALLTLILCIKCIRNMRQSDAISFENGGAVISDSDFEAETPLDVHRSTIESCYSDRPPSFPARRSTPPPNYEAALMLPVLTEEQRELAISTLSLHRVP